MKKRKKIKNLIIAAFAPELKFLKQHPKLPKNTILFETGIGPVAAVFGLTEFLHEYEPEQIFAIATAGILDSTKLNIGEAVVVKSVSSQSQLKNVYTPKLQESQIKLSTQLFSKLKKVNVYCPQEISKSESLVKNLAQNKFDVEHLESFAWAYVAKKFGINLHIVLGLANKAGKNAHKQWKSNADSAMMDVCQVLLDIL